MPPDTPKIAVNEKRITRRYLRLKTQRLAVTKYDKTENVDIKGTYTTQYQLSTHKNGQRIQNNVNNCIGHWQNSYLITNIQRFSEKYIKMKVLQDGWQESLYRHKKMFTMTTH